MPIEFRAMEERDLPQVMTIEQSCFSMPWSEEAMRKEISGNDAAHYLVAVSDGQVAGYGGYWQVFDEAYITNIAVAEEFRRQGIGTGLMQALEADERRRGILYSTLEVRVSNAAARAMYIRSGFYEAGIRPGYYERPREDACIMWKKL